MIPVTVILTSCGRLDLLQQTLDSFLRLNKYDIHAFLINDDSGTELTLETRFIKISNSNRIGLSKSLDYLLSQVETEYYFHCEDDWLFEGNPNFIEDSIQIMERYKSVHHVWVRDSEDHTHPLGNFIKLNGITCREVQPGYMKHWSGFSFNPGLKRKSDYERMFPNGYAEFGDEILCSQQANKFDYKAVSLAYSACKHIGYGRHTSNFIN